MADGNARRTQAGQPAIAPALRDDYCTPHEVLEVVYRILGDEIGIDPAWNPNAIVRARHTCVLPPGSTTKDVCGGLVEPWHEHGTFFNNPPYGKDVVDKWVTKAIAEYNAGAEGIQLLPSYTSSYFFDDLWRHASVICFWGRPGRTNSRVKFLGADDSATFGVLLAYYGDRVEHVAQVFDEVGHVLVPEVIRRWMRLVGGHVIPGTGVDIDEEAMADPLYQAARRLQKRRYDDLIYAAHPVQELTVGDLVDAESPLVEHILSLTVGEVVGGLAMLTAGADDSPGPRQVATRRRSRSAANISSNIVPTTRKQLDLLPPPSPAAQRKIDLDRQILAIVRESGSEGISGGDLKRKLDDVTPGMFRGSLSRLQERALIATTGQRFTMRYFPT